MLIIVRSEKTAPLGARQLAGRQQTVSEEKMKRTILVVGMLVAVTGCQSPAAHSQLPADKFRAELKSIAPSYIDRLTEHERILGRQLSTEEARMFLQKVVGAVDDDQPGLHPR